MFSTGLNWRIGCNDRCNVIGTFDRSFLWLLAWNVGLVELPGNMLSYAYDTLLK